MTICEFYLDGFYYGARAQSGQLLGYYKRACGSKKLNAISGKDLSTAAAVAKYDMRWWRKAMRLGKH
jgi:hypothetical protein